MNLFPKIEKEMEDREKYPDGCGLLEGEGINPIEVAKVATNLGFFFAIEGTTVQILLPLPFVEIFHKMLVKYDVKDPIELLSQLDDAKRKRKLN
jgi:hypothetical protein